MDDRGWGCAYRSLQTISSWYRAQGFTSAGVPSHKDMQLTLVKLGGTLNTQSCRLSSAFEQAWVAAEAAHSKLILQGTALILTRQLSRLAWGMHAAKFQYTVLCEIPASAVLAWHGWVFWSAPGLQLTLVNQCSGACARRRQAARLCGQQGVDWGSGAELCAR